MRNSLGNQIFRWAANSIRNSQYRWLVILGSLFYLVSPLDIVPDFLPIIGWVDDGLLASFVVSELTQWVLEKRQKQANSPQTASTPTGAETVIDVESVTVG